MAKRIPFSLCVLTSVILAGVPAQAATAPQTQLIAQSGIAVVVPQIAAEPSVSEPATLTLEDLPPGFTALPPELAAQVASRLESLKQQLGQTNLKPEKFFAFVNPQNFQVVLGFTGKFPNESEQASFDTSLQQLQQPDAQQLLLGQLQAKLQGLGGLKVTDYQAIPELNNLANASTGVTFGLEMQNQPLSFDVAAFRRNAVGAFTAVMYAKGEQPTIGVGDVARKLDEQIVKASTQATSAPATSSQ